MSEVNGGALSFDDLAVGCINCASDSDYLALLAHKDARAGQTFVALLHGRHGPKAAQLAWGTLRDGVGFGGDYDIVLPIADYLLMEQRIETIKDIALAGLPEVGRAAFPSDAPPSQSEWLDFLCTHGASGNGDPDEGPQDFIGFAAWRSTTHKECGDGSAIQALQFGWELNPAHPTLERLASESTEEGSIVRQLLMSNSLALSQSRPARQRMRV